MWLFHLFFPEFFKYDMSRYRYLDITKTRLYNFDPLIPHFYIVKLGLQGYTLYFIFLLKNIDCGYSLEPPHRGGSNEYQQLCFEQNFEKYQSFLSELFQFLEVKFSIYLNRRVFVMSISKIPFDFEIKRIDVSCLQLIQQLLVTNL